MTVFYIFAVLAFLSVCLLLFLSSLLFNRMNDCLETAQAARRFYEKTLENAKNLEKEVLEYRQITEDTQSRQNDLELAFKDLKETALALQSAHQARKAVLDLMRE